MRLRLAFALLSCAGPALVQANPNEVLIRGTADGAIIRVPGASLDDCRLIQPLAPRIVVSIGNSSLSSRMVPNNATWLRSVRVIGADVLGGSESRLVVEVSGSWFASRLESAGDGVALVITGGIGGQRHVEPPKRAARAAEAASDRPANRPVQRAPATDEHADAWHPATAAEEPAAAPPSPAPTPRTGRAAQPARDDVPGMVTVGGGEFVMGSLDGTSFADESPEHVVRLRAFRIDAREVTVDEFSRSPLPLPRQPAWSQDPAAPVTNVTWHEAAEYCEWAGKRLPTEAEWERAARGTDRRAHPWGPEFSVAAANSGLDGDGYEHLAPVGSFPEGASIYGALDLSGNAWEWTADWYGKDSYARARILEPNGPSQGSRKVTRGGSFRSSTSTTATTTVRLPLSPSTRRDDVGFRCASSD